MQHLERQEISSLPKREEKPCAHQVSVGYSHCLPASEDCHSHAAVGLEGHLSEEYFTFCYVSA